MLSRFPNWVLWVVAILTLVGFTDSSFLLAKRVSGGPVPCFITTGCDEVLTSQYSSIPINIGSVNFEIPLALMGIIFYLTVGFLLLLYVDMKKLFIAKLILLTTTIGFLSSLSFIYIQGFLIGQYCTYCLLSAATSTLLFILGVKIFRQASMPHSV